MLRPWQLGDLQALIEACQHPELGRFTRIRSPYREREGRAFIAEVGAWIEVDPRNAPSLRVAERAGFLRERLLRSFAEVHEQPRVVMFSMLRGEQR